MPEQVPVEFFDKYAILVDGIRDLLSSELPVEITTKYPKAAEIIPAYQEAAKKAHSSLSLLEGNQLPKIEPNSSLEKIYDELASKSKAVIQLNPSEREIVEECLGLARTAFIGAQAAYIRGAIAQTKNPEDVQANPHLQTAYHSLAHLIQASREAELGKYTIWPSFIYAKTFLGIQGERLFATYNGIPFAQGDLERGMSAMMAIAGSLMSSQRKGSESQKP